MADRRRYNLKRRLIEHRPPQPELDALAERVRYEGSPYHKRSPGDFALQPPSQPRPDKTLCDGAGIVRREDAQRYLEEGVRYGLLSEDPVQGFPRYVWAVTAERVVLEARLTTREAGTYHGYPLFEADPFRDAVLRRSAPGGE